MPIIVSGMVRHRASSLPPLLFSPSASPRLSSLYDRASSSSSRTDGMVGLVIFTGANSSMGIPAADHLLQAYRGYTVIFTVRDASHSDVNTEKLRSTIARHPNAKASVLPLDLASLSATHEFADTIVAGIQSGKYPRIAAIVCNAYYWNLVGDPEVTDDGFDKTFQVSHISHAALALRLLGSFGESGGRVILISSDSHWPGKNGMEVYPPNIDNLEQLVRPTVDEDKQGRGYQRYATAKLAITAWMHALNRHLVGVRFAKSYVVLPVYSALADFSSLIRTHDSVT